MNSNSKIIRNILYVFLALLFVLTCCVSTITLCATSTTNYSGVLEDLQKDPNFDESIYVEDNNNYSISVIQIAESVNKELFVYVYQPAQRMVKTTSINISTTTGEAIKPINYELQLIDSSNTLYKYLVVDFVVSDDTVRYYNIPSIFRLYNIAIDDELDNDNTVSEVVYEVAKLYTLKTVDNQIVYDCQATEVVEIVDKYVGFVRYDSDREWTSIGGTLDSHYVAFSTDRDIDMLYEADVDFVSRSYTATGNNYTYEDSEDKSVTVSYHERVEYEDGLFKKHKYIWQRISTAKDFVSNNDLSSDVEEDILTMQYVLQFYETAYTETPVVSVPGSNLKNAKGTQVTDVTILRLKFEENGEVYNLGVVDNKQSGDTTPDNADDDLWEKLKKILIIVGIVLLCVVFLPFILYLLFFVIKYIIKIIWWILSLPFKLIKKE